MGLAVYTLCTLTSLACAWLLMRSYINSRHRLLFWSGLFFVGLTINNALVIVDLIVFPGIDMALWRLGTAMISISILLFGLIWEEK